MQQKHNKKLDDYKIYDRETYNDAIKRVVTDKISKSKQKGG